MHRIHQVLLLSCVAGLLACAEIAGPVSALQKGCETATDCPEEGWDCYEGHCLALPAVCDGDGIVEAGEACDDGNRSELDGCSNQCTLARCGDGLLRRDLSAGETGYEACDDGNEDNGDACTNDCREASCGDGILAAGHGEECEDGNRNDDDGCLNNCRVARCGDQVIQVGVEACDDGNDSDGDGCTTDCQLARCGDGIWRQGLEVGDVGFEACDDGNEDNADGCSNDCELPRCGDGFLAEENGEECDDGNENNTDECVDNKEDIRCQLARCGDGFLRQDLAEGEAGYELCDDGNAVDGDGCTNDCQLARCGDGVVRTDIEPGFPGFEACDDGNAVETDACSSRCEQARCGDGLVQEGVEACDDGNRSPDDACLNDCQAARCGDGQRYLEVEACDDGNAVETDACRNDCSLARCGDGVLRRDLVTMHDPGFEACEPGFDNGRRFCRADCRFGPKPTDLAMTSGAVVRLVDDVVHATDRGEVVVQAEGRGIVTMGYSKGSICPIDNQARVTCHSVDGGWQVYFYAFPIGDPVMDASYSLSADPDCVVTTRGELKCWDRERIFPRVRPGLQDIVRFARSFDGYAGIRVAVALDSAGTAFLWDGWDDENTRLTGPVPMIDVTFGGTCGSGDNRGAYLCFLGSDGLVYGVEERGVLRASDRFGRGPVLQIMGDAFSATCVIRDNPARQVACLGDGWMGALGQGDEVDHRHTSVDVPGMTDIRTLAGYWRGFCAEKLNGEMWCWGQNLGDRYLAGNRDKVLSPTQVLGFPIP